MTCWNCGQAADKHIPEAGNRPACPPDPGPSEVDFGLMASAVGAIKTADATIEMVLARMRREGRGLVEVEELLAARSYLASATKCTRRAAHDG